MRAILDRIRQEPAVVVALVGSLITLGVSFGLPVTDTQRGAIIAVVVAVLGFVTRRKVTPVAKAGGKDVPAGD